MAVAAAMSVSALAVSAPAMAEEDVDLVTILTAPDAQTQLMSMVLTLQSIQAGASAHIPALRPRRRHGAAGSTRIRHPRRRSRAA